MKRERDGKEREGRKEGRSENKKKNCKKDGGKKEEKGVGRGKR